MEKEYRTKSGRVLTDAEIQAFADEAEEGYDVEALTPSARVQDEGLEYDVCEDGGIVSEHEADADAAIAAALTLRRRRDGEDVPAVVTVLVTTAKSRELFS